MPAFAEASLIGLEQRRRASPTEAPGRKLHGKQVTAASTPPLTQGVRSLKSRRNRNRSAQGRNPPGAGLSRSGRQQARLRDPVSLEEPRERKGGEGISARNRNTQEPKP